MPRNEPPERFPVRFYLVAMIFIVFDIEIIFLYPYAVIFRELGAFGLVEMLVFAIAVFASFVFLIANGALDWGPVQQLRRASRRRQPQPHHRLHHPPGRRRRPRRPTTPQEVAA